MGLWFEVDVMKVIRKKEDKMLFNFKKIIRGFVSLFVNESIYI